MIHRCAAASAALMLAVSCSGGGGPASATPPTVAMPAFRDGWTEAAVTNARANPPSPGMDVHVHVEAPGYLPRETVFEAAPLYLWPGDRAYVEALVYFPEVDGRLTRWTEGGFAIGLGPLEPDAEVRAVVEEAAREAERASGLTITTAVTGPVSLGIVPGDPAFTRVPGAVAVTYLTLVGSRIVSALILFKTRADITGEPPAPYSNAVLHEIGHVLGLGHSPRRDDVMDPGTGDRTRERVFSERERMQIKMMYRWRSPGNLAPDRDPGVRSADRTWRVVAIVD